MQVIIIKIHDAKTCKIGEEICHWNINEFLRYYICDSSYEHDFVVCDWDNSIIIIYNVMEHMAKCWIAFWNVTKFRTKEECILNVHLNLYIYLFFVNISSIFSKTFTSSSGKAGSSRKIVPFFNLLAPLWYPLAAPRRWQWTRERRDVRHSGAPVATGEGKIQWACKEVGYFLASQRLSKFTDVLWRRRWRPVA